MPDFPSRMLFHAVATCPHLRSEPEPDGSLRATRGHEPLPPLAELDGRPAFAEVWALWHESGLYVAEYCPKPEGTVAVNRRRPHSGDGLQVWLDTRAARGAHRASRFCHHFILLPKGGGSSREEPTAWQARIRRAREHAPICEPEQIRIAAHIGDNYYTVEAFLPAAILTGFEPREGSRIGFNYLAHDIPAGRQLWSAPHGLPSDTDPSLWGALELEE